MLRRTLCVLAATVSLTVVGCQHILQKDGTYSEFENIAMRLDYEFNQLHLDVKEILFGLEPRSFEHGHSAWNIYDD